ncbi:MAG: hypothetical protein QXG01_02675, partial [Candidatus Bathyarchaeia archaeon]
MVEKLADEVFKEILDAEKKAEEIMSNASKEANLIIKEAEERALKSSEEILSRLLSEARERAKLILK